MKCLVTGAKGFIGHHLLKRLLSDGHKVLAYIKPPVPQNFHRSRINTITGNLSSGLGLDQIDWEDIDAVIHLAAAGVKSSHRNWTDCISVNINGTEQLIHAISKVSSPPLLVYPRTFYEDYLSEIPSLKKNPYVVTKKAGTKIVELWARDNENARVVIGTVFHAYGAEDDPGNVLTYTANCLRNGVTAKLGSGKHLRDWIYIDDLVDAFIRALKVSGNGIQYYDFGTGKLTSLKVMTEIFANIMSASKDLLHFNAKRDRGDSDLMSYAKKLLPGWIPKYSIESGLLEFNRCLNKKWNN